MAQAPAPADPAETLDSLRLVLGASLTHGPVYFGQRRSEWGLKPMVALRWGWLRIGNSGAGGLIGEANAGGASADLLTTPDWRLRAGLRLDRGRHLSAADAQRLAELPDVRGTLRARLTLSRRLGADASWNLSTAPDLFGRGGGTQLQLGYYRRLTELDAAAGIGGQWSLGASLSGGDERYMQSYFGVPVGPAPAGLPGRGRLARRHAVAELAARAGRRRLLDAAGRRQRAAAARAGRQVAHRRAPQQLQRQARAGLALLIATERCCSGRVLRASDAPAAARAGPPGPPASARAHTAG
jgi:outer membrane scaffolding protein for murein synthesis (MipA/OmpV family)